MTNPIPTQAATSLTVKRFLYPLLSHPRVARTLKYIVYGSLLINTGRYFLDDYLAMQAALPPDASLADYLTQFSTTIDMFAWVGLVFLFEFETYTVPEEKWTTRLAATIRALRAICYIGIAYAAYGYTVEALENFETTQVAGVNNVCQLADQNTSLQINVFAYTDITSKNCANLSSDNKFYRIANEVSVIGESTLNHVQWVQLVDIDNAYVWLVVVFLIEFEVWMQARDRFSSSALNATRIAKTGGYVVLIANMFIWGFASYYLYAWDAFLWIFGFWAIELNLAEYEIERREELAQI